MNKPFEFGIILLGFLSGSFFQDAVLKIIVTVVAMVVGTTAAHYWKRYLNRKK